MSAQAMSLMLPPAVQREDVPDDPVAAKLECMTLNGAPEACCSTRLSKQPCTYSLHYLHTFWRRSWHGACLTVCAGN